MKVSSEGTAVNCHLLLDVTGEVAEGGIKYLRFNHCKTYICVMDYVDLYLKNTQLIYYILRICILICNSQLS